MARIKAQRAFLILLGLFLAILPGAAAPGGELEKNKAVARRLFEEALCQGKWDVFQEIHTQDFVAHAGKRTASLAEDLDAAKGWQQAFPDGQCRVDQIVAEGDLVTVRWTGRGTNTGAGNGLPATGKPAEIYGITIFRVKDGKLAEEWGLIDTWGLMKQLGLASAPKQ
jgi:steroid delta-isomerase-like uncharacterized protein